MELNVHQNRVVFTEKVKNIFLWEGTPQYAADTPPRTSSP